MARARQILIIGSPRGRKTKGIAINKKSIGTIVVNGTPMTYNADLVYSNQVTTQQIVEDSEPKKKIILIKRK